MKAMDVAKLWELGKRTSLPVYAPKLIMARGEGAWLWDVEGRKYLDFLSGIAVTLLGHGHPVYTERVTKQLATLTHVSNTYFSEPQILLAERLVELTFAQRVFYCNSGAEANEAAIKLARRFQRVGRKEDRYEIVAMNGSFHGRTMGALSATGQPKYHEHFGPLVPGFVHATFNDLADVTSKVTDKTAAIIVEPIMGESGVIPAQREFLAGLRQLCDEQGLLLIFDEVQTGIGRTGTLFAYEQFGVVPDMLTTAKGIANGIPMGALLCKDAVADSLVKAAHATTFGGNPIATAAALAVLDIIASENLLSRCRTTGERLRQGLASLSQRFERLGEVRGMGLMLGVPVTGDPLTIMDASLQAGLLHNTAGTAIRFLPPLILSESEVDEGLNRLETALLRAK